MRNLLLIGVLSVLGLGSPAFAEDPTLLIFKSKWCGPCQQLTAAIDREPELVSGYSVAEFDISAEPELAKNYSVRSVPTLIILEPSGKMRRKTGFTGSENLRQWLRQKN